MARTKNDATAWAKVTFVDEEQRNRAAVIFELKLCQTVFPINIIRKRGPTQKYIQTKVLKDDDPDAVKSQSRHVQKNLFRVCTSSREAALQIFSASSPDADWTVGGSATVTVLRTDLYPDFQQILDGICAKFSVPMKSSQLANSSQRVVFKSWSGGKFVCLRPDAKTKNIVYQTALQ